MADPADIRSEFDDLFQTVAAPERVHSPVAPFLNGYPSQPEPAWVEPEIDELAKADWAAAETRLGDALPETGFIAEFIRAHMVITTAPVEFHLITALVALATCAGNRIAYRDRNLIFPHLYAVIVAPSTTWHKSTSSDLMQELLARAYPQYNLPTVFSTEGFLSALTKQPAGLVPFDEFGQLLLQAAKDYNGDLKSLLMTLYGAPRVFRKTLSSKEFQIYRPAFSILGATTADNLTDALPKVDLTTGFINRFIWVTATKKVSGRPRTAEGFRVPAAWGNRLVKGLARIRAIGPQPTVPPGPVDPVEVHIPAIEIANAVFENENGEEEDTWWYHHTQRSQERVGFDVAPFAGRFQIVGFKLAILYHLSDCALDPSLDPLVVSEKALVAALRYVVVLWDAMIDVLGSQLAFTVNEANLNRLRGLVTGKVRQSSVLKKYGGLSKDFRQVLDTLLDTDEVVRHEAEHYGPGRPPVWLEPGPAHSRYAEYLAGVEQRAIEAASVRGAATAKAAGTARLSDGFAQIPTREPAWPPTPITTHGDSGMYVDPGTRSV